MVLVVLSLTVNIAISTYAGSCLNAILLPCLALFSAKLLVSTNIGNKLVVLAERQEDMVRMWRRGFPSANKKEAGASFLSGFNMPVPSDFKPWKYLADIVFEDIGFFFV